MNVGLVCYGWNGIGDNNIGDNVVIEYNNNNIECLLASGERHRNEDRTFACNTQRCPGKCFQNPQLSADNPRKNQYLVNHE